MSFLALLLFQGNRIQTDVGMWKLWPLTPQHGRCPGPQVSWATLGAAGFFWSDWHLGGRTRKGFCRSLQLSKAPWFLQFSVTRLTLLTKVKTLFLCLAQTELLWLWVGFWEPVIHFPSLPCNKFIHRLGIMQEAQMYGFAAPACLSALFS